MVKQSGVRIASMRRLFQTYIFMVTKIYKPETDPPYEKYFQVVELIELEERSLLIAHHGINHLYTYEKSFRDALNYIPDFPVPVENLWRLAYRIPYATISKMYSENVGKKLIKKLPYEYVLIREDLWQEYLQREDDEIAEIDKEIEKKRHRLKEIYKALGE